MHTLSEGPAPQVGDHLQVRGRRFTIARIDGTKVWAKSPEPLAREVACAISELRILRTDDGKAWHLPGTAEARVARPGAVSLGAAVFEVNAEYHAQHGGGHG